MQSRPLLLTIDFINDIVHPDGKIASCATMVKEQGVIDCAVAAACPAHRSYTAGRRIDLPSHRTDGT